MNRADYFKKQKELALKAASAEAETVRRIRKVTREHILPLVKQYLETGAVSFPLEALAHDITQAIIEEGRKPAMAARRLQMDMERWLSEKLGINIPPRWKDETPEEARARRLKNAKVPKGEIIVLPGQGFAAAGRQQKNARKHTEEDWMAMRKKRTAGEITEVQWRLFETEYYEERKRGCGGKMANAPQTYRGTGIGVGIGIRPGDYVSRAAGMAGYYRDPQTGRVVWTDLPLEYQFRKRADLSTQVWKAVEDQEQMILDVVRGGIASGRDVKHIAKDLETFINYPDGGKRVVGRWMGMFPDTEAGRKAAWEHEYLAQYSIDPNSESGKALIKQLDKSESKYFEEHGKLQFGSRTAEDLLKDPQAKGWVERKMAEKTKRGTPLLPDAVKRYASRLGNAGLDYRAIRICRTEQTAMLADEQLAIAEDSGICTGEMDFVMERGRDHWNCLCESYAEQNPWKVDDPARPEIPVHPNCMCEWRPRLKTDEQIIADMEAKLKDLEEGGGSGEAEGGDQQPSELPGYEPPGEEDSGSVDMEKRFGKEFTQLYNESMTYIDNKGNIPANVKKELDDYLAINGKTMDGFIAEVNDFVKTGEVVRHDMLDNFLENIDDFENDPRIKTQFETGTSQGYLGEDERNHWERRLIGKAENYGEDPNKTDLSNYGIANVHRPVYAEVTKFHPLEGNAKGYGDRKIAFVFSDNAKNRASFTLDNSSNLGVGSFRNDAASVFSKPMVDARDNARNFYQAQRYSSCYVEAQVWGGIDLSKGDVKAVVISDEVFIDRKNDTSFQRFIKVVENSGVTVIKSSAWGNQMNRKIVDKTEVKLYNNIKMGDKMRLLAKAGKNNFIYDAGDNWFHAPGHSDGFYLPKDKKPKYPLAACLKWGFQPVDVGYLNALSKGGLKAVEEYVKANPQ